MSSPPLSESGTMSDFIRREVLAARCKKLIEMAGLAQLEQFRQTGIGSDEEAGQWMHAFSQVLLSPSEVAILRTDDGTASS